MKYPTFVKLLTKPSAPRDGTISVYAKGDDQLYFEDAQGVEYLLGQTPNPYAVGSPERFSIALSGQATFMSTYAFDVVRTVTAVSMSMWVQVAIGSFVMGIYDNTGAGISASQLNIPGPGTKLAQCPEISPKAQNWNTTALQAQVVLAPGTYWMAFLPQSSSLELRRSGLGTGRIHSFVGSQTYSATMPAAFPAIGNTDDAVVSMYVTVQEAAV